MALHFLNCKKLYKLHNQVPPILAGGINKDNVKQAIDFVKPFGIDLFSSVSINEHFEQAKLAAFFSKSE
ncbi:MAG: N-(5phosphoribosyl)anthranilate isomerase [Bacteroidales bacterium]|nr:N-(5phosphoribosyl)anthranilate isomerase [Bacteroidales bacterium]